MDNSLQKLSAILIELRNASMEIKNNNVKSVMDKYDMLFLGGKFNCINSVELLHSMKKVFDFEISNDQLIELIPIACKSLNMKYQPMTSLENITTNNRQIECYMIDLW